MDDNYFDDKRVRLCCPRCGGPLERVIRSTVRQGVHGYIVLPDRTTESEMTASVLYDRVTSRLESTSIECVDVGGCGGAWANVYRVGDEIELRREAATLASRGLTVGRA